MSWFFEVRRRNSEKNGLILAHRNFGSWNVSVGNCGQTSPYLNRMWNEAFEKLAVFAGNQRIHSVLMLGLGAGGEIAKINKTYPGSRLTVIEYDEEMIALTKELGLYKPAPLPNIICNDAAVAVPQLSETFDLIIVDMFKGPSPSPLSQDQKFLAELNSKLSPTGFMLVNIYAKSEIFTDIGKQFLLLKTWKFEENNIGLFTKNTAGEAMAEGYIPVREWPDHNPLLTMADMNGSYIGEGKKRGLYWRFGPFSFEHYHGDDEPVLSALPSEKARPLRILMWQRHTSADVPSKWFSFGKQLSQKIGFLKLDSDYKKEWSETSRRYLNKWQREFLGSIYAVEEVSYDEFAETYLRSTIPASLKRPTLWEIRMRMKNLDTPMTFIAARRTNDGRIVAGMAYVTSSQVPVSYYMAGCITNDVGNDPVMTGLFHYWFEWCKARHVVFADFGGFWWKGGDSSWKGLSRFKGKFGPRYFFYPAKLFQFRFGNQKS